MPLFGAAAPRFVACATLLGGHVRVGFGNNANLSSGAMVTDNSELVRSCLEVLDRLGLRSATCAETRRLYGVSPETAHIMSNHH
jgi:uncharacterized protein (DUF849 family)